MRNGIVRPNLNYFLIFINSRENFISIYLLIPSITCKIINEYIKRAVNVHTL